MSTAPSGKRILFVALSKKQASPTLGQLRVGGNVVSMVDDLDSASNLLASGGFDQAMLPAPLLVSLVERFLSSEAATLESWRRTAAGILHDLRVLMKALERCLKEASEPAAKRDEARLAEVLHRIFALSSFIEELAEEMSSGSREELRPQNVHLEEALEAAALSVYPMATDKRLRFLTDIEDSLTHIRADPFEIKRALVALLRYAVHHSPQGGAVSIRAWLEGDECLISVSESAEGISQAEIRRLFGPTAEAGAGEGVSLARTRRAIEKHGGRIWVESQKGCGTSIFLSLPHPLEANEGPDHRSSHQAG